MADQIKWFLVFTSLEKAIDQVPDNRAVVVELEDKKLCLTRSNESFYAFEDKCPHQGSPLNKGKFEAGHFICPWHRFEFNLNNGREKTGNCDALKMYFTKIENNKVYIGVKQNTSWWLKWLK